MTAFFKTSRWSNVGYVVEEIPKGNIPQIQIRVRFEPRRGYLESSVLISAPLACLKLQRIDTDESEHSKRCGFYNIYANQKLHLTIYIKTQFSPCEDK